MVAFISHLPVQRVLAVAEEIYTWAYGWDLQLRVFS